MTTSARRRSARVVRRRRLVALAALVALGVALTLVFALTRGSDTEPTASGTHEQAGGQVPPSPPQLPRGGTRLLPDFRIVAYYGAPQDRELGALGVGTPAHAAARLARQAKPYVRKTRPVLPALELIAVIAQGAPGPRGRYSLRQRDSVIRRYLRAARAAKALLVLDIQPGHSDFFTETTRLRKWLREPDVGLALDPEWHVGPGQVPGQVIGSVTAREVNATSGWLSKLVTQYHLPEKLLLVHQFTFDMVPVRALKRRPGLAMVVNADGFGGRAIKVAKYRAFMRAARARHFRRGFKLFYEEDTNLMTPRQVLRMGPPPDVVVYE